MLHLRRRVPQHSTRFMLPLSWTETDAGLPGAAFQGFEVTGKGQKRLREIVEECVRFGIRYLTVFAFSTENWKRSTEEVDGLMSLFRIYANSEVDTLVRNGARFRFIGDVEGLDAPLVKQILELEKTDPRGRQARVDGRPELRCTEGTCQGIEAGGKTGGRKESSVFQRSARKFSVRNSIRTICPTLT